MGRTVLVSKYARDVLAAVDGGRFRHNDAAVQDVCRSTCAERRPSERLLPSSRLVFRRDSSVLGWVEILGAGSQRRLDWPLLHPILELSMMMLDYYEYTGDKKFAKETLVPG